MHGKVGTQDGDDLLLLKKQQKMRFTSTRQLQQRRGGRTDQLLNLTIANLQRFGLQSEATRRRFNPATKRVSAIESKTRGRGQGCNRPANKTTPARQSFQRFG